MARSGPSSEQLRERDLGLRSLAFLHDQVGAGVAGLSPTDALLVLAINQANIVPLTREPLARIRYGAMQSPAPDVRRRPMSVNAVAESLGLPFETVRRHVQALIDRGVVARGETGLIVPEAFLVSPAYVQTVMVGHWRLLQFFREVRSAGWNEDLPRSAYPPEDQVPIRAAARLLADYVLRAAASLLPLAGGVAPLVVLLGVVAAGGQPISASALARHVGVPTETARRHALRLAEQGLCQRTTTGFVVDESSLEGPAWETFFRDNTADVQRLFAGLAERGVVEAWARLAPAQLDIGTTRASS